jgi:hypothetical protein
LGPVLLCGRFSKEQYYKHFVKLIKLLWICLQFEISKMNWQRLGRVFKIGLKHLNGTLISCYSFRVFFF